MMFNRSRLLFALALTATLAVSAFAQPTDARLSAKDVDVEASFILVDGERMPADRGTLLQVLGLAQAGEDRAWWTGQPRRAPKPGLCHYVLVFKRPIEAGAIGWNGWPQTTKAWLIDGNAADGTRLPALDSDAWTALPVPRMNHGMSIAAVPQGRSVRAVMLVDDVTRGTGVSDVRLFAPRLHDVTRSAVAYANKERYVDPYMGSPYYHKAMWVVWGNGEWQNTGQNKEGRIDDPPVSDVHPAWFMLTWKEPQTIAALQLVSNIVEFELDVFEGPDDINPRVGLDDEWRRVRDVTRSGAWLNFKPVTTRGIRIRITKTTDGPVASIAAMRAYIDLHDMPVPEAVAEEPEPSPVQFDVEVPHDGTLTIAIDDADGNRVRNLVALEPVKAGAYRAQWDLRDMDGLAVTPGTYHWKAISAPPLELRYQMTPYPNVRMFSDTNTPWLNGTSDCGGWMADHTPTHSVATAGDQVYMGATVPESGVALIETDLAGVKHWGHHSFEAWTGPRFLAADDATVYAAAWTCRLWTIDRKTHEVRQLARLESTNSRLRKLVGIEAHDGTLYLAHRASEPWLVNAATAADVDIENTIPRYRVPREPTRPHQFVADFRANFLGLLRLTSFPPGQFHQTLSSLQTQGGTTNKQHIVVPFHKPISLGSAILPRPHGKDVRVKLSVLKADAEYPPNPGREADWVPFETQAKAVWDVAAAPADTQTRALRITFIKGEEDIFSADNNAGDFDHGELLDEGLDRLDTGGSLLGGGEQWTGTLDGIKLLRRRYRNVFPQADVRTSSGTIAADGTWDARRDTPLTRDDPAVYLMHWDKPQKVRGLAFKEADAKTVLIDVWEGDGPPPDDVTAGDHWREVGTYQQQRRRYQNFATHERNEQAHYVDGYAAFADEVTTRAIRLRFVEQWVDNGDKGQWGVREDRGGLEIDTTRCRLYGVAVMQALGGEAEVKPVVYQRIEAIDRDSAKIVGEVHVPNVGAIACDSAGTMYALSGNSVVKVDMADGKHTTIVDGDLKSPRTLAADDGGRLYVFDGAGDRQHVRVYDATSGSLLHTFGTDGGRTAGPWDAESFGNVTDIDVDAQGQLWAVEFSHRPKRVAVWADVATKPRFVREHLGNTEYGGGGVLDRWDKSRLYYRGMAFDLDWETGKTRLKTLLWDGPDPAPEVPVLIGDKRYFTNRPQWSRQEMPVAIVFREQGDHLVYAAAMGNAGEFEPLKQPQIMRALGTDQLAANYFLWCDLNGDTQVQADEVELWPRSERDDGVSVFDLTLGTNIGEYRVEVDRFLPSGVPAFKRSTLPMDGTLYKLDDGNYHRFGGPFTAAYAPDGKQLWKYKTEGSGVHALYHCGPYTRDQVVSEFYIAGHETAQAGELGEFMVTNANIGRWYIFTADGLLAGQLFEDIRAPNRLPWRMSHVERNMLLDNVSAGQEHFAGWFCRTREDDRYYAVAGHNHASVVEVIGLDRYTRHHGSFAVSPADVKNVSDWSAKRGAEDAYERASVVDLYRLKALPRIDGNTGDWNVPPTATIDENAQLYLGYNDKHLFVGVNARGLGPFKNSGTQWDRLFKTGAAIDLQIGTDTAAPRARKNPVAGDVRLLMTFMNGKPTAVLYEPVVEGDKPAQPWIAQSPIARIAFDRVRRIDDTEMAVGTPEFFNGYQFEAVIPLDALGWSPKPDTRLRFDWGLLLTGPEGHEVTRRMYWSNRNTAILSDVPSEAQLQPGLWGHMRVQGERKSTLDRAMEAAASGGETDSEVGEFLEELGID